MTLYYTWTSIFKITSHQRLTYAVSAFIENDKNSILTTYLPELPAFNSVNEIKNTINTILE